MMLQHLFSDLYSYLSHLALCPSFYSVLSRSFYNSYTIFSLPVNPMSMYLKPKSSQLDTLLRASKWQETVIDTALPVISPVGLLRPLYDGQADLAGTERDINKEDPLKSEERSSSYELHWVEGAGLVPQGNVHKAVFTSFTPTYIHAVPACCRSTWIWKELEKCNVNLQRLMLWPVGGSVVSCYDWQLTVHHLFEVVFVWPWWQEVLY